MQLYAAAHDETRFYLNDGGHLLWKTDLEAGSGESGLAYLDGYVYHSHGAVLFAVEAETGQIVHVEEPPDGSYFWEVGTGGGKAFAQTSSLLLAYEPFQPR